MNRKQYEASIHEIYDATHTLHTLISAAMDEIGHTTFTAGTAEWRRLHSMMKATSILSDLAYDDLYSKPSAFSADEPADA